MEWTLQCSSARCLVLAYHHLITTHYRYLLPLLRPEYYSLPLLSPDYLVLVLSTTHRAVADGVDPAVQLRLVSRVGREVPLHGRVEVRLVRPQGGRGDQRGAP